MIDERAKGLLSAPADAARLRRVVAEKRAALAAHDKERERLAAKLAAAEEQLAAAVLAEVELLERVTPAALAAALVKAAGERFAARALLAEAQTEKDTAKAEAAIADADAAHAQALAEIEAALAVASAVPSMKDTTKEH